MRFLKFHRQKLPKSSGEAEPPKRAEVKPQGFTLIELIIVIAVFAVLSVSVFVGYRAASAGLELKTYSFRVVDALALARQRTIASLGASSYGVHFEASQFVVFKGTVYDAFSPDNIFYSLPSSLEIADLALSGGGSEVVFDRISGKTAQSGTLKVRLTGDPTRYKTITILSSGRADISADALPLAGTRVADSRHVHFSYNQDVRPATTMTLDFPGYFSRDINFQDYLDPGKTVFDWSGTILVNGSNQILRIHTHNIGLTSADFSVTRDLRYNNAALRVLLGAQELIQYDATGTTTQGTSIWVTAPVWQ